MCPKGGWLFVVALLLQVGVAYARPVGLPTLVQSAAIVVSYSLLLAGATANLHTWGFRLLLAGLVLNFLAIALNGWLMPVSPEALLQAGYAGDVSAGSGSSFLSVKSAVLPRENTRLWLLTDTIAVRRPFGNVFSIGDVVIVVAVVVILGQLLLTLLHQRKP